MRRRTQELTGQAPIGSDRIPYDRTDPMQEVAAPAGPPPPGGPAAPPPPDLGGGGVGGPQGLLANVGAQGLPPDVGGQPPANTDQMSNVDLAQLDAPINDLQTPEELQVAQMEQALNDPNTPPGVRDQIVQQLDLAARRRFAGLGGGAGGGMGV